ncbi:MAG: YggT family protein [Chlamydiota bacterium]
MSFIGTLAYNSKEFIEFYGGKKYMLVLLAEIIHLLFLVYTLMLFGRILGSWIPEFRQHRFMVFLHFYTEPYLRFFRRFIPPLGMIDLSPLVAFFALRIMERVILSLLLY